MTTIIATMKKGFPPKDQQVIEKTDPHLPDLKRLVQLYAELSESKTSFCYRGPFLDRFTNTILEISESSLATHQQGPIMTRKVSFLLVECFQNILRHGENVVGTEPLLTDDGLFSFRDVLGTFVINSINFIQQEETERLKKMVDDINSLDTKELKALYLQQLNDKELSSKGGAGLGLIELARKSGQNLLYAIHPITPQISCFQQQVTFCQNDIKKEIPSYLMSTQSTYQEMSADNVLLTYKGDFSQKSILPLLDIVEHNIGETSEQDARTRKAGHILIEMLQNVAKHGGSTKHGQDGVFQVGQRNGSLFIQAGNPVSLESKICLEEKLGYLTELNKEELKELHKTALRASLKFESKIKSGLGLIEVAKLSIGKLDYGFEPIDRENYFFVIRATL
jgi:hypothetical protein